MPEISTDKNIVESRSAGQIAKQPARKNGKINRKTGIILEGLNRLSGLENGERKIQAIGTVQKGELRYKIP